MIFLSLFFCKTIFGQDVAAQLQNGISNLEKDPQFKHAILSMYVVDSKTGKVIESTEIAKTTARIICSSKATTITYTLYT